MAGISADEAKSFYDWFGARQDAQGWYEDRAIAALIDAAELATCRRLVEFGCGTGRVAAGLLADRLPADASYLGIDVSSTMVGLARARLARFGARAEVQGRADACAGLPVADGSIDRVFATYALELLRPEDLAALLEAAHRALSPRGLLCAVNLTHGPGGLARAISWAWGRIVALSPARLGGCRPIDLAAALPTDAWEVIHHQVITAWGVSSEVVVARRRAPPRP